MHLTLVTIAKFSATMLWVVGFLMVADLVCLALIALRIGKVDPEEGHVVTERGSGSGGALNPVVGGVGGGRYLIKQKVFLSRSGYITAESLVDGTATKSERLFVHCFGLLSVLFWLLFVFIGLNLLPTEPIGGTFFVVFPTIVFFRLAVGIHRDRVETLRKLQMKRETAARG